MRMLYVAGITIVILGAVIVLLHVRFRKTISEADNEVRELRARNHQIGATVNRATAAAKAAQELDNWHRDLFRQSRDLVIIYEVDEDDLPGHIVKANDVACSLLGYERDAICKLTMLDIEIVDESYLQRAASAKVERLAALANTMRLGRDSSLASRAMQLGVRRILREHEVRYEGGFITREGKRVPVQIHAAPSSLNRRTLIVCTAHDLTEQRRANDRLHEIEQRYEDFVTTSPVGIAVFDGQHQLVDVNASCLKMFGFPDRTEFLKFNLFSNPFIPAHVQRDIKQGNSVSFELALDFTQAIQEGLFVSSRTGIGHYDVLFNNLGHDRDYNARGYLVLIQNITQRHETALILRQRERQLRQAQKLEAIGALAGGIAHDFNNILTPILGYAQLGMELCSDGDQLYTFMTEILTSSRRAKELVGQILTFSRQSEGTSHPMRITPIVKEVLKQTAASIPNAIKVSRVLATEEDLVLATPTQIHQILMNLCTNAVHVMKDSGGELQLRLSSFALGRHHRKEFPHLVTREYLLEEKPKRYLRISVRDTGRGMDAETMERIFEPFFTTKPSGEGTGMGLAVVHGIVLSLDGSISVESEVGKGSVFHVALPAVGEPAVKPAEALPLMPSEGHNILFVDDEVGIVKMAEHMLRAMGFNPVVTNHSAKALEIFTQRPDEFDLVISDQVMPELTGAELSEKILAIRPDIPIILCTGFSESLTSDQAQSLGIREIVMKPVEMNELAQAINRAMTPPPPSENDGTTVIDGGRSPLEDGKTQLSL
jgi:signal transduction histidine kinase/CheY-like chemotaxis protein